LLCHKLVIFSEFFVFLLQVGLQMFSTPALRKFLFSFVLLLPSLFGQTVFINEFHYDNAGIDTNERIEIAGPAGTDVTGWRIVRYNGNVPSAGVVYTSSAANPAGSDTLSGSIPNTTGTGFGFITVSYLTDGLQNGANDGFALVRADNTVVQFLCYEGVMTATGPASPSNPAGGLTCTDIGQQEPGTTPVGHSLQLSGTGSVYSDFTWQAPAASTFGAANTGQTFTASGTPSLSINNVTVTEGNSGNTSATFTVSLTSPAGPSGVSFNYATADDTATLANNDYQQITTTAGSIPSGSSSTTITVLVSGDTSIEPTEAFLVNITNVTGANLADGQGIGTITNDDVAPVNCNPTHSISQLQGSGNSSAWTGQTVIVDAIVTAAKFNGFFLQEPDANADADPLTSEGIFVFTSSAPPAAATVGNLVCVTGTVFEFSTGFSTMTQLTSATAQVISTGNPLPAPIQLTTTFPSAGGGLFQLERLEGMRVSIPSLTAVTATTESSFENAAFYAVVTGVALPFREPGIQAPLGIPVGSSKSIPPVPQFDANPELLRIDQRGQSQLSGPAVTAGQVITGITGVMDFNSRGYEVAVDTTAAPTFSAAPTFTAVPVAASNQVTMGHVALRNYTGTATQQAKALRLVRDVLRYPDVLGVTEVNTITALNNLRDAINTGQAGLNYAAYLGSGAGSQNIGFLVKTSRVTVLGVPGQVLDSVQWTDSADGVLKQLHDRPPYVLQGRVNNPVSGTFDFTAIMLHLRSLIDVDSDVLAAPLNLTTDGDRTRTKRRLAAESVAQFIQQRQTSNPSERIIIVGDYNAFEFNDGYVDILGTLTGAPTADARVIQSSADLVNPNFIPLVTSQKIPASQKYSYIFGGSRQVLDHVLVSQTLGAFVSSFGYARVASEFPESLSADTSRPERVTDHDPAIAFITLPNNPIEDISGRVVISNTGLFFNGTTYSGFIRVTNTSGAALSGPLNILIDQLAPGVTVTNAAGTYLGRPYLTFPSTLAAGATAQVQVIYSNPGNVLTRTVARLLQGTF
jgi:uncharacterized protein